MTDTYDHKTSEPRWQNAWEDTGLFQDSAEKEKVNVNQTHQPVNSSTHSHTNNKMYLLFAFAYPSGSGLHVGHVESKTALDILARYYRMNGKDVFFPVGWDAFGLPAENYAIKTGVPPAETTVKAINTFRRQIKRVGISYDWENEIATSHPEYYKWTQWIFLQLFNKELAYKKGGMVNWCPSCQTVLANEQVVDGLCERCDHEVVQKELDQWYFKITEYKDELIDGLDQVDWPKPTEDQQKHWIGRSEGVNVTFKLQATSDTPQAKELTTFTTRVDTIFGVTFLVMSPEKIKEWVDAGWDAPEAVIKYIDKAFKKTEEERMKGEKDKTGVDTGLKAINPVNQAEVPIFVADYVLAGYGTGVVMGVPAHDSRDHAFAVKHNLEIIQVIDNGENHDYQKEAMASEGVLINSAEFDGVPYQEAMQTIPEKFSDQMEVTTTYKLRDWLISRQRYWGAPIPIVYDPQGKAHPVKEEHLPWELPTDVEFKPSGESPLKDSKELHQRVEKLYGKGWKPEYDTMDTFVDSSWYFLRYLDSRNEKEFASKEQLKQWLPVDFYMIGPEHIVLHLLYARFITKFLRDEGYLCEVKSRIQNTEDRTQKMEHGTSNMEDSAFGVRSSKFRGLDPHDHGAHRKAGLFCVSEPFTKMRHQGMILGPDNKKMSKSKGNVIDPDTVIEKYGADALRVYEMFMGPIDADKPWNERSVVGVKRFLDRVHRLVLQSVESDESVTAVQKALHKTIKKVSEDIPELKFNTAIAAMMEFVNEWDSQVKAQSLKVKTESQKSKGLDRHSEPDSESNTPVLSSDDILMFVQILAPFAPFLAEELFQDLELRTRKIEHRTPKDSNFDVRSSMFHSIHQTDWPSFDPKLIVDEKATYVIQVNGKVRDSFEIDKDSGSDEAKTVATAKDRDKVSKWLDEGEIRKTIFIPAKGNKQGLINFVVA